MNPTLAVALSYGIVVGGVLAYLVGQWLQDSALRRRLSRGDDPNAG